MATWQEIGQDNFEAARELYINGRYRSSVSRFYYAAYAALTGEPLKTSFQPKSDREAPDHAHMPEWIKNYLTRFSPRQRADMAKLIRQLYEARIGADYKLRTTDEKTARDSRRNAVALLQYLEEDK